VFISGCDSGFGKLSALQLSRRGCTVLAGCLTQPGIKNLLAEKLPNLIPFELDITSQESIENAVTLIKKHCADYPLWAIINNAGIAPLGLIDLITLEDFRKVLEVNFFGHVSITQKLIPLLKKSNGRVVNTSSVVGRGMAAVGLTAYIVSKRAVEAFNDCLRLELRPFEIGVSVVEPGFMNTDILTKSYQSSQQLKDTISKEKLEEYQEYFNRVDRVFEKIPQLLVGNPQQVSDVYTHAVLAKYPKQRYLVGTDAWLLFSWLPLLPSWIADYIHTLMRKLELN